PRGGRRAEAEREPTGPALTMTPRCQGTASPPWVSWAVAPAASRFDGTPAAPAFTARRGATGHAAAVGRATNGISATPSQGNRLDAEAPSQVHPTPAAAPREGGNA